MSFFSGAKELLSGRRSVTGMVKAAVRGYRTVRVAVMGSRASGKTVFLTSLANHLRDHRPDLFPLDGMRVHWDKVAVLEKKVHGLPLFDYDDARSSLAGGRWPRKTLTSSVLAHRLLLRHRNGKHERVQLELVDIPGERMADFTMKGRSYRDWCRWMQTEQSSALYRGYLDAVCKIGPKDTSALFDAYRDFLCFEYESFSTCITPSTVKLSLAGERRGGSPEEFRAAIADVPRGFEGRNGKVYEFIPLPESLFEDNPEWIAVIHRFTRNYDRYKAKVVLPIVDWLSGAEKLFYLVDVLSLLQDGPLACDSERRYGEGAIGALCRRTGGMIDGIWKWVSGFLWKTRISSVCVVATKADLVLSEYNRENMSMLADNLFGRALAFLDRRHVSSEILSCAAVCGTKEVVVDGKRGLQGRRECSGDSSVEIWEPSDVPASFPSSSAEWEQMIADGKFNYQFAFPWFDPVQICPPRQLGLNLLAQKILVG
jgi:predicted YcjX-like family ATPase